MKGEPFHVPLKDKASTESQHVPRKDEVFLQPIER